MTTIDSLQIEIQSNSTNASQGIRDLAKSLGELKNNGTVNVAIKNLNSLSGALRNFTDASNATRSVGKLVGALKQLKEIGSISSVGNSLTKLSASLKSLDSIKIDNVAPQILRIADAVSPLSSVKAGGLSSMVNALMKIGKVTAELDDDKIAAFAARIEKLNDVLTPLSTKMTTIQAGLKGINSKARSAGSSVRQMGDDLDASSINMASFIYTIQEAVQWLQQAIEKFSSFIAQAIEWDGIAARFGRGFGPEAQATYEWIQRLNEEMGINVQQFMQYSSIYATMLTGFGVAVEDATKMALGYTELTYDIWAGYNDVYKTFEEASEAVKSAIAGEVEPIRRAGFTIVESTLQQTAANHGLNISIEKATEAQKSYLRYLTLVDQAHAQNLVGTYAKELNTAEGLMRTFSQQVKSLSQAFGSLFLPILVRVMPYLQAFVEILTEGVQALAAMFGIEIMGVDWSGYNSGVENAVQNTESLGGAMDKAAEAAKELKNATIGIDELNVISPPSSSAGGGAGGAGGGAGGGNGFDGLDIDSLWDESIFKDINNQADAIKEKLKSWMPVIATIGAALGGLAVTSLITSIGEAIAEMNVLQKLFSSIAILTIEALLVFAFADNYLESGNLLNLVGEALVTAASGYLMFKAWGPAGATLALGVSIIAQLIAIETSLADGTVNLSSPELWIQAALTVLTAALGGAIIAKKTAFFVSEGLIIGLAASLSLTMTAINMGAIESGAIDSGSFESWIMQAVSVAGAGMTGFTIGKALKTGGGPTGLIMGVTVGLVLNLASVAGAKGEDFGDNFSDWLSVAVTGVMTAISAAKIWGWISATLVPALKALVTTYIAPALTTALTAIAGILGVSVGWAVAIVAAIAAAIGGAIYAATHWEEVKAFFTETIPAWFAGLGAILAPFFKETIPAWFSAAWEEIKHFFSETIPNFFTETIPGWAHSIGYGIGYVIGLAARTIVDWWNEDVIPFFTETIPTFFTESVPAFFSRAWDWIKNFFTVTVPDFFAGVWAGIVTFVTKTVPTFFTEKVPEWFAGAWQGIVTFFTTTVPEFFSTVLDTMKTVGKYLVEGWWEGVTGRFEWALNLVKEFVTGIIDGFKDAFGIASPSTIFAEIGGFLVEGLWQGLKDKVYWITGKIGGWVDDIITAVKNFFGIKSPSTQFKALGGFLIEGLWEGIKDKATWIIDKIGGWVEDVLKAVKDFFGIASPSKKFKEIGGFLTDGLVDGMSDISALVDPLKKMWNKATDWLDDTDLNLSFTPSIGSIADTLKSRWESAKTYWGKKSALKTYTAPLGSIYESLKGRWDNARNWWNKKKSKLNSYTPSIGSIYEPLSTRWKNARDWWNKKKPKLSNFTPTVGSLTDKLKSSWNSAKKWWSKNVRLDTKLNIKVPTVKVKWETASAFGKSFKYPKGFDLKFAAAGGIFDAGSLIWAGERGAEVVANAGGGRTGVMNVQQMQDAVFEGVYAAVMAANRASNGDGAPAFNIYLDGKQITATVEKRQRERGTTIMGNQVYTYG